MNLEKALADILNCNPAEALVKRKAEEEDHLFFEKVSFDSLKEYLEIREDVDALMAKLRKRGIPHLFYAVPKADVTIEENNDEGATIGINATKAAIAFNGMDIDKETYDNMPPEEREVLTARLYTTGWHEVRRAMDKATERV